MRLGLGGLVLLVVVGAVVLWVTALVQAATAPWLTSTERLLWLLLIVLASFVGTVLWFAIGRARATAPRPPSPGRPPLA